MHFIVQSGNNKLYHLNDLHKDLHKFRIIFSEVC